MKKVFVSVLISFLITAFGYTAMAQDDNRKKEEKDKKETQEIIIRKKGDKDVNINIQISGDKVTINGKPLVEFKDNEITVNKRKIIVTQGDNLYFNADGMDELGRLGDFSWNDDGQKEEGAFLGVTTEKCKEGAKIIDLTEESAASKGELKEADVITKFGDIKIDGPESLYKAVTAKKPNDEVKVYFLRDGKEKSVKVRLQERKQSTGVFSFTSPDGSHKTLTIPYEKQRQAYDDQLRSYKDMYQQKLLTTPGLDYSYSFPRQKKLGLRIQDTEEGNAVKVLDVEDSSAAATAGLKKDDIITEIAGVKVTNTDEVREQLQENMEKSSYNIKARRNGTEMSFDIKIPKKLKTANL
ncbi:hypothetical protein BH11BAC4_BH11BAC4_21490 [soil metagenome]